MTAILSDRAGARDLDAALAEVKASFLAALQSNRGTGGSGAADRISERSLVSPEEAGIRMTRSCADLSVGAGLPAMAVCLSPIGVPDTPLSSIRYLHNFGTTLNLWRGSLLP